MRCFIAIEFDEATRSVLARIQKAMREFGVRGNYTRLPNLHLTLKFLGDITPDVATRVEGIMKKIAAEHKPFVLEFGELGKFSKGRHPTVWCGLKPNGLLLSLQRSLVEKLAAERHEFSGYEGYTPHITLVREAALNVDSFREMLSHTDSKTSEGVLLEGLLRKTQKPHHRVMVKGLSLMESTRDNGRLVYSRKAFVALNDH